MKKPITKDFSRIIRGRVYGTNSRKIYEGFCATLKWDCGKAGNFGTQGAPLYAENCDTARKFDVWFISRPTYIESGVMVNNHINYIKNNGDEIIEKVSQSIGRSNDAGRIVFVKTNSGYEFLGVYKLSENGTTRKFKRISEYYPIK